MRVWHGGFGGRVLGCPLVGAGRALAQLPLVAEQGLEVAVVPSCRGGRPGALNAAGDGVHTLAATKAVLPAQALILDAGALGFGPHVLAGVGRAMGLAEGVAAGHQGHRLLVVHRHAGKCFAHVAGRADGVGVAVGPLGVHVDQAHLHGGQRLGQLAVAGVALVVQPLALRTPVDFFFRLPDVGPPAGEAEGLEPHRFERDVAGQDDQIRPRDLAPVLLLDRPQQPARLVEVAVVRPAVQGREALRTGARTAAAIGHAVGAGAVPGHANEERPIVAIVGGPPVLRVGHQGVQVLDHGVQVQGLELLRVIERRPQRVGRWGVLVQHLQAELVGPPIGVALRSGRGLLAGIA